MATITIKVGNYMDQASRVVVTTCADNMDQPSSRMVVITTPDDADNMDQASGVVITTPTDADNMDVASSRIVVITTPDNADNMDQASGVVITTPIDADNMDEASSRMVVITTPDDADNMDQASGVVITTPTDADNMDQASRRFARGTCRPIRCANGKNIRVWIMGDSYVRRGAQRAAETTGRNLDLNDVSICWFGWGGLRWRRLIPFFQSCLRGRAAPDVLLIHCGGNDLGETTSVELVTRMKEDLHQLHHWHPHMMIMFSSLCQRCQWRAGANPGVAGGDWVLASAGEFRKWVWSKSLLCHIRSGI
ncbi:hypothetical protein D5F01_LYC19144 [Larimichthys crocea]|uniref:SGNH hydrolase-type esterase domain-containing protein n=1 Tax=Larimichthys crocea TaxID=215358 RepID=A0A6G0HRW5_LARCR|nr:hypothetical protein D5F01_LYC19144 [Larimichthys crocea]